MEKFNLKKIILQHNQKADFTSNYSENAKLRKKLLLIGTPLSIVGFLAVISAFVVIAIYGSDIKLIGQHTALLVSMMVMLVVFVAVFCVGLFVLKNAYCLHQSKDDQPQVIEIEKADEK